MFALSYLKMFRNVNGSEFMTFSRTIIISSIFIEFGNYRDVFVGENQRLHLISSVCDRMNGKSTW